MEKVITKLTPDEIDEQANGVFWLYDNLMERMNEMAAATAEDLIGAYNEDEMTKTDVYNVISAFRKMVGAGMVGEAMAELIEDIVDNETSFTDEELEAFDE